MRRMASRGDRTREHLLDVAEQLFGTDGVANVSLRQIRIAAGQRNEGAVQYHFTDRDGVIRALSGRHMPGIQAIQDRIVAGHRARPTLRDLVDAFTRPLAEYAALGPSERAWMKILAELVSDPKLSLETVRDNSPTDVAGVGRAIYEDLAGRCGPDLAVERIWAVAQFVIHIVADRARLLDEPQAARPLSSNDAFVDNLVDMAYGALTARVVRTVAPEP